MFPIIMHIYGPLTIYSYGLFILTGVVVFSWLFLRDCKLITTDMYFSMVNYCLVAGLLGGHWLHLLFCPEEYTSWVSIFAVWHGLSILGTLGAILFTICIFLYIHGIPIRAVLDRAAIYAPLAQAFGRVGCFLAGCCHGCPTDVFWAVTYTHEACQAPLFIPLHPTQLYSAALLVLLFAFLYRIRNAAWRPGQLLGIYLCGVGLERFVTDLLRNDRIFIGSISGYAMISLLFCIMGTYFFFQRRT